MENFGGGCVVDGQRGSGGGGNTVAFASCDSGRHPLAIRAGLNAHGNSEGQVVVAHTEQVLQIVQTVWSPEMPATTRLLVEAVLVGLNAIAASRPLRRLMTLNEVQSENAWREKFRFKSFAFHVFAPATSCRLCITESLDFTVDIFPETLGSVLDQIEQLDLLELLIFLWGYNFDLRQMVEYRFFPDCHLGNILVLPATEGSKSEPPHGKRLRFAWHDFGSHSYHSRPSGHELREFADKHEEAMNATVRRLGNLNRNLERLLKPRIEKMVADTSYDVISSLTRTLEQVQNAIMKWRDPDAGRIQATMMQMWIWSGDPRFRIQEFPELAQTRRWVKSGGSIGCFLFCLSSFCPVCLLRTSI